MANSSFASRAPMGRSSFISGASRVKGGQGGDSEERFGQVCGEAAAEVLGEMLTEAALQAKVRRKPEEPTAMEVEDHMARQRGVLTSRGALIALAGEYPAAAGPDHRTEGRSCRSWLHMSCMFMDD